MSQITRCPSCTTSFKVVPDQLRISEGWVRCGHCQHVFDATLHLQSVPASSGASAAPNISGTAIEEAAAPAAAAVSPASSAAASADPWEIPLPPPPAPSTPEDTATAASEALDFAAPELALELDLPAAARPTPVAIPASLAVPAAPPTSPDSAASVELDWPEQAVPAPMVAAPAVVAPPPPPPAAPAIPAAPAPIPASSIPTDIDWPEPALEPEPDPAASTALANGSASDAPAEPVMPELDLTPSLAPLPQQPLAATSSDERIEPSWSSAPPATSPPPIAALAPFDEEDAPVRAPLPPAAAIPAAAAAAAADTSADASTSAARKHPHEPSFVRAARRQALWRQPAVRLGLALLALLLLLALIGQILLHDRHRLAAAHPSWRPMLELLCAPLDCKVQLHRQIGAVVVESSSFNRVDGGVYHFAVTLKNRSDLVLEMPAVELTLTDANEQPVLRRVFTPQQLGAGHTLAAHAESSSTVLVRIAATGNAPMAGYRVLAFYP